MHFFEENYLWNVVHSETCANPYHDEYDYYSRQCQYKIIHDNELWVYLAIVAAVGVAFLAGALLLYRKRRLESAGDFAAVRPIKTVFTLLGSIAVGMLFYVFVGEVSLAGYIAAWRHCWLLRVPDAAPAHH